MNTNQTIRALQSEKCKMQIDAQGVPPIFPGIPILHFALWRTTRSCANQKVEIARLASWLESVKKLTEELRVLPWRVGS